MSRANRRFKRKQKQQEQKVNQQAVLALQDKMQKAFDAEDYSGAIDALAELVQAASYDPAYLYLGARSYFMLQDYTRASQMIENTLSFAPGHIDARILLARICVLENRTDDGLAILDFVLEHSGASLSEDQRKELESLLEFYAYNDSDHLRTDFPHIAAFLHLTEEPEDAEEDIAEVRPATVVETAERETIEAPLGQAPEEKQEDKAQAEAETQKQLEQIRQQPISVAEKIRLCHAFAGAHFISQDFAGAEQKRISCCWISFAIDLSARSRQDAGFLPFRYRMGEADMDKKQVVIVIPVYKKKLSLTEQASLLQVQKIWGKYPRVFMAPEGLDFDYGPMMDGFTVERFPSMYFKGVTGYSILLLTPAFYERFQEYEYMQIYQLDAFVFYDALPKYCAAGYDYIGAPVRWYGPHWHAIGTEVGNGGFSLRRVSSCLRMVRQLEEQEGKVPLYTAFSACEDMFFGYCGTRPELDFHVPDTSYAVRYAVQDNVRHAYQRLAKGEIPMGCHGWSKSYYPVWEELIRQAGYNLGGPYPRQLTYQDVYLKKYRTYHRKMAVGRLYGLIHRKEWQPALNLLTQWLQKWPAGDEVWAAQGEEWVFLSFISMMPDEPDSMMAGLLTQALLEALRRSLLVGEEWQENLNRAKTVLYTMEQQHISLPLDTHVLEQAVQQAAWKAWQEKAPERPVWAHREDGIRIVAVTAVHNEADVVESFVRHTLRFADALIVCDCNSTDQTAHILAELQQEGLPLTVHAAYGDGQDTLLPAMLQEAVQEQGADYVLPLEADAFLLPQQGTCRAVIGQRSPDTIYAIPQRRYVSAEAYADQASFLLDRPLYRSKSCSDVQGYLIGAKAAGHLQLQMKQGNLTAVPIDAQGEKQMRALEEIPSLSIARFPWRSPEQYRARVAMRWPEIAMRYSVDTAEGGRYRADYMRLLEGQDVPWQELLPDFEPADLRAFVPSQKLQYSEGVKPDAWRTLLAASEHLAEKAAIERTIAKHICATTVAPRSGYGCLQRMAISLPSWRSGQRGNTFSGSCRARRFSRSSFRT